MPPSTLSLSYDAVLSTTFFNWSKTLHDTVSKSNYFFYHLMKEAEDSWELIDDLGDRAAFPLMYEIGTADSYSGYDPLDVTPTDGITTAFYEWRQASVPVSISGLEEEKNSGEARMISLLKAKTKQAELGIHDFMNKSLLQGNGGSSITSPYTSAANGSQFVDPLPLLIKYDPTTATTVGNIPQGTYSWWRNKTYNSTSSTYKAFLKELRKLHRDVCKGPGGKPTMHLADEDSFGLYEAALADMHRNTSYQRADIPFDNVLFRGKPVTWDEYVPDVQGGSATQSTASGTWWMLNTEFWKMKVNRRRNFVATTFQKPENGDSRVGHVLFMGAAVCGNRRKQGVMGGIDTTTAA